MADLHRGGGRTIAQDAASSVVFGMPGELVRRGGASAVLPSDRIADEILGWLLPSETASREATHAAAADSRSQEVAAFVTEVIGGVQFQDVVRQRLEQVTRGLSLLDECSATLADVIGALPEQRPIDGVLTTVRGLVDCGMRCGTAEAKRPAEPLVELFG
jgi:hypothetical protein